MNKLLKARANRAKKAFQAAGYTAVGSLALVGGANAAIDASAVTAEITSGITVVETIIVAMLGFGVVFLVGRSLYGLVKR